MSLNVVGVKTAICILLLVVRVCVFEERLKGKTKRIYYVVVRARDTRENTKLTSAFTTLR